MLPSAPVLVEACVATPVEVARAVRAGARRLELCATLAGGGVTPTGALLERVASGTSVEVVALVRVAGTGPGGFRHDASTFDWLEAEVEAALSAGARGIAAGVLDERGAVHRRQLERLVRLVEPHPFVFHRAFDLAANPLEALEALADAGVARVLSSGGSPSAYAGRAALAELVERAAGRLTVVAAGGVGPEHALELVRATGVTELHGSFRRPSPSRGERAAELELPEASRTLDEERLRATMAALAKL